MVSFICYYQSLYNKALKDRTIPDADFIIENYKGPDPRSHTRWTEDEIKQFNDLILSAGKHWRKRRVWEKMETRNYNQFNARYTVI